MKINRILSDDVYPRGAVEKEADSSDYAPITRKRRFLVRDVFHFLNTELTGGRSSTREGFHWKTRLLHSAVTLRRMEAALPR